MTNPVTNQAAQPPIQPVSGGIAKEQEMPALVDTPMEEVVEHEIPTEVKKHVAKTHERIDIPPDLQQVGVTSSGQDVTVSQVVKPSGPKLPLTDDQIAVGLHARIKTSLRWLAEWCFKQLKKAHYHLTQVGNHFTRTRD